ncbi:MAG TPA: PA2779 family protein [Terriglobales bacterium]|nr:PA2779 family protein [Terriglobales bacterium]
MSSGPLCHLRMLLTCVFVSLFAFAPQNLAAQTHVVSSSDLQHTVTATTQTRAQNIARLNEFFSTAAAQKALRDAKFDATQVKNGIGTLDDAELANLAARAQKAQKDFAAGAITDHLLVLIVIAIAVVIIIILAAKL